MDDKVQVQLTPMPDSFLEATEAYVLPLQEASYSVMVSSEQDMIAATELQSKIRKATKAVDAKRKVYTKPLDDKKKEIKGAFDLLTNILITSDQAIDNKVMTYRREQQRAREQALKAVEEQQVNNNTDKSVAVEPPPPLITRTDDVTFVKTKEWIVIDFSAIPDEYKTVNSVAINKAVHDGVKVPGIEIYEKEGMRTRA